MVSQYVLQDKGGVLSLWRRHPLYIHIAAVFLALLLAACATIAWTNYVQGRQIVLSSAEDLLVQLEQRTAADIDHMRTPLFSVINLLSQGPLTNADSFGARFEHVSRLADILKHHDSIAAVYFGYYDGDFFLLRALRDAATRKQFAAPRHAAFLVQSMERKNGARARLILLDVGSSRVDLQACKLEYSIVSPK